MDFGLHAFLTFRLPWLQIIFRQMFVVNWMPRVEGRQINKFNFCSFYHNQE